MKYRVVETKAGHFKCQYRVLFFWWRDSCHAPSRDKNEQIDFAKSDPLSNPEVARVVWP